MGVRFTFDDCRGGNPDKHKGCPGEIVYRDIHVAECDCPHHKTEPEVKTADRPGFSEIALPMLQTWKVTT
jgi:hypothetical protein